MDWDYAFESPFPLPAEMWDDSNAQPRTLPFTNSDALMLGFSLDHLVHDDEQDDIVDTLGRLETGGSSDDELIDSLSSYEEPTSLRVSIPSCNNAPPVGLPTPKATPVAAETPDCAATADKVLKTQHATSTSTRIPSPSPPPISLPTPVEEGGSPHTPDLASDDDQTPPATHPATPSPQEVCDVVVKQEILDDHFAKQDIGPAVDINPPCSPPSSPLATAPALPPCHAPISPRLAKKETAADNTPSSNSDTARSSPLLTSSPTPVMTAAENPPMEATPCSPRSSPQFTAPRTTQPETGPEPDAEEDALSAGVDASASSPSPDYAPDGSTIPTAAPAAATTTLPMVSPRCTQVTPLTSTPMDETQLALAPKSEPEPRQPERGRSAPVTTTPTTARSPAREPTITATDSATTAAPTTGSAGNGLEPAISASEQPASTKLANDNTGGNSTLDCPVTAVDSVGSEQTKDQAPSLSTLHNVLSNEAMKEAVADLRRTEAVVAAQPGSRVEVAGEVGVPLTPLPTAAVDTQNAQKTPSPHTAPEKRHALPRVKVMFYKEELLLNEPLAPNQQTTELPDDVVTSTGQVLQPAEPLPTPTVSEANSSDAASPSDLGSAATVAPSERPSTALQLLSAYKSPTPSMTDDEHVPPIDTELPLPGPCQLPTAPDAAQLSRMGAGQTSGPVTAQKSEPSDTQDALLSSSPSVGVPEAGLGSTEAVSSSSPTSTPSIPSTTMEGVARPGATPNEDACGLPTPPLTAKYATFSAVTPPSDSADILPPIVVKEASPMKNPAASASAKYGVASPEAHMSTASTPTSEALLTPFEIKHDMTTNRFDTITTPSDCQLPLGAGWTCPPVSMVRGTFNDADESTTADDLPADSKGDAQLDGRLALDVSSPAAEQELVATTPASGKSPKKAPSKGPGKWELKNLLSQSVSFMSFDQHSSGSRRLPATKYWTPSIVTSEPTPLSPKKNATIKTKKQPSTSRRRRVSSASQNAVMEAATVALKKNNAAGCSVEGVTENDEAKDAPAPSDSLPPHNPAPMPKRSNTSGQIPPSFMVALAEPSSPVVEQPIPSSALRARARPKRPQQSRTAPTLQNGSPQTASPAVETLHLPSTSSPETGSPLTPPPPSPRRSVKRKLDDLDPQTESVNDGPTKKKAPSRSYCEAEDAIIHRFFPFSDSSSPPARAAANECIKELKCQGYPHRSTDALLYRVRTSIWKTSIRRKH